MKYEFYSPHSLATCLTELQKEFKKPYQLGFNRIPLRIRILRERENQYLVAFSLYSLISEIGIRGYLTEDEDGDVVFKGSSFTNLISKVYYLSLPLIMSSCSVLYSILDSNPVVLIFGIVVGLLSTWGYITRIQLRVGWITKKVANVMDQIV